MEISKKEFCNELAKLLKYTRNGNNIDKIDYIRKDYEADGKQYYDEFAEIHFCGDYVKRVNITQSSNFAIIKDVIKSFE